MDSREHRPARRDLFRRIGAGTLGGALAWGVFRAGGGSSGPDSWRPAFWVADAGSRRAWLLDAHLVRRAHLSLPPGCSLVSGEESGVSVLVPGERGAFLEWRGRDGRRRRRAAWDGVPRRLVRSTLREEDGAERWVRLEASGEVCESALWAGGARELGRLRVPGARWLFAQADGVFVAATRSLWLAFRLGSRPGILESREVRGRVLDAAPAPDGWRALVARGERREVESWSSGLRCRFRVPVPGDVAKVSVDPEGSSWSVFQRGQRLVRVAGNGELAQSDPRTGLGGVELPPRGVRAHLSCVQCTETFLFLLRYRK